MSMEVSWFVGILYRLEVRLVYWPKGCGVCEDLQFRALISGTSRMIKTEAVSASRDLRGLKELEAAILRDLELTNYPVRQWLPERKGKDGTSILDVLIVGGGQSGITCAFGLMREKVTNILVIDENDEGLEGPWLNFARMLTLRTPKHLTGPDLGLPNLTLRAWYEAQFGGEAWQKLGLLPKEQWAEYLLWYRKLLKIPFKNRTRAGAIEWCAESNCFVVPVESPEGQSRILARKVVLSTGIDGCGRWDIPSVISSSLPKQFYAHTREDIDFAALKGKSVAVLGAGASAFDNASVALETGASEIHLFYRREDLPNVNPYRWAEFVGFLKHHGDLPDELKYKFVAQIIKMGQLPPADTFERARKHANFKLHGGSSWDSISHQDKRIQISTSKGKFDVDFVIVGTGFVTDLSLRSELANFKDKIALWSDRYTPNEGERSEDLLRHPYLGPSFEFTEKNAGEAPYLKDLYCYTFGCLLSLGFGGASISGMKYSIPRIVGGITRDFYLEYANDFLQSLKSYDLREF